MCKKDTCRNRITDLYKSRIADLRKLWKLYQEGDESDPDLGTFSEYGLSFDYVPAGTIRGQKVAYFRYQLSWGGPSDEFRFFVNPDFSVHRIEYWFMDWFDGAKKVLTGKDYAFLEEIFCFFREIGTVEAAYKAGEQ